jgi:uncharacterized membrane protein
MVASVVDDPRTRAKPLSADTFEKMLAYGAAIMLAAVILAILRGQAEWSRVPMLVWAHLLTIGIALALTPVMLLRQRGDRRHRRIGRVWAGAMASTALVSLGVHTMNDGRFSVIHILSVWTLIQVPIIVWSARRHNVRKHRSAVRGMVFGALLIAGFFTFPFDRLLGHWLFG